MSDTRNDDAPTLEQQAPAAQSVPQPPDHPGQPHPDQYDQYGQYDQPPHSQHSQWAGSGWTQAPAPAPGQPSGPTAWYGAAAQSPRAGRPRPPWFWPVIAVAVGLAALLAGGGAGFAIGHAIGTHHTQSTTQVPGQGTNRFPGQGGGTNQLPGQNGGTGTDGSTGTGGIGTDGTGS